MEEAARALLPTQEIAASHRTLWLSKIDIPAYGKGEDLFNAISHLAGVLFGVFALGWSLNALLLAHSPIQAIAGMSVYCVSLITLYAVSGAYHLLQPGNAKRVMRVMDHCTIYLLIAGCYTPVTLIAFWGHPYAPAMLFAQWAIAFVGILLNIINMTDIRVKVMSIVSYIVMGWMIIVIPFDQLLELGASWFPWILAGGIAYTLGIIFYGIGSKVRYMHCIWHIFVLVGSILQFVGFVQMI